MAWVAPLVGIALPLAIGLIGQLVIAPAATEQMTRQMIGIFTALMTMQLMMAMLMMPIQMMASMMYYRWW